LEASLKSKKKNSLLVEIQHNGKDKRDLNYFDYVAVLAPHTIIIALVSVIGYFIGWILCAFAMFLARGDIPNLMFQGVFDFGKGNFLLLAIVLASAIASIISLIVFFTSPLISLYYALNEYDKIRHFKVHGRIKMAISSLGYVLIMGTIYNLIIYGIHGYNQFAETFIVTSIYGLIFIMINTAFFNSSVN
jgi:hypothetical protein